MPIHTQWMVCRNTLLQIHIGKQRSSRLHLRPPDGRAGEGEDRYKPADLDKWAKRAKAWAKNSDAFIYFISGDKVRNPAAAQALIAKV